MAVNLDNPSALVYWGAIQGAAARGENTAGVWQAVRDASEALGYENNLISFQDVNRLRAAAGAVNRAALAFGSADGSEPVTSSHFAVAPYSRDQDQMNALGLYQARVQHVTNVDGREETTWRTITFTGGLPPTVNDLRDAIDQDSEAMADQYGVQHVGVGSIQIMAI